MFKSVQKRIIQGSTRTFRGIIRGCMAMCSKGRKDELDTGPPARPPRAAVTERFGAWALRVAEEATRECLILKYERTSSCLYAITSIYATTVTQYYRVFVYG